MQSSDEVDPQRVEAVDGAPGPETFPPDMRCRFLGASIPRKRQRRGCEEVRDDELREA